MKKIVGYIGTNSTNRHLSIDFWIPNLKIGIEVNGAQHYKPISHWGGEKEFEKQIYRDSLKDLFFKQNELILIKVNNKKLTKIEEYLNERKDKEKKQIRC